LQVEELQTKTCEELVESFYRLS